MLDVRPSSAGVPSSSARVPTASPFVSSGGELRLSNAGQLELLRGLAERGAPLRTGVRGHSMAPFVRDGDVVTIAPLAGGSPAVGDVVAFAVPHTDRMAVHRIIARKSAGWLIRGDNCPAPDGVVAGDAIVGRVTRVERDGRDVRLGLGAQGPWVAAGSRGGVLALARAVWRAPRRAAAGALRAAQGTRAYRRAARRLAPSFTVAAATDADLEAVWRHLSPGVPPYRRPNGPDVVRLVARAGGQVFGFVEFVRHPDERGEWAGDWLFSLAVWGLHRGRGIGEALTRRVIAEAEARGAAELLLAVFEDNARAISLYRKLGFAPVIVAALEPGFEAEKREFGRRRIVMRRPLRGEVRRLGDHGRVCESEAARSRSGR